ncbi:hypothetical protein [Lentilactobacillus parakefiri]|uniref:Uncharacterized protein n=1 Tax=Lentilactobacillus parakefiri TaxID=152332 RepID=A0A269Y359_9LACO|nr:hypothetical protein [Lentilactobacillus parakefiri]PAK79993.1 hypothetical protein B8W98_08965 [Lentilactobacillus parakefiri]PAL00970.1 hypothetical protein B8W96_04130 [Lentilactobacillus parakefiri]TDG95251.1 hypothetical protein C5L28_001425 [Lentilactobacillus parakefiri]GAW72221.1 hypothetical protein LPKJCM_01332 [Lentilactobacillus parakefiri]
MKKSKLFLIVGAVIFVLAVAFFITKSWHLSVLSFALVWLIAIIVIRVILTPLVVVLVRQREADENRHDKS